MKTKSCIVPSILLMLSLEAALLVAGRPSAAAVADDVDTIRLPSDGQDRAATRPWKCCDRAFCTKSIPPICTCVDEVDQCSSTCKACAPSMLNPSRHVCEDRYIGDTGPECTEDGDLKAKGASHDHQVGVAAANKNGEEEKRPWKCCDLALCTMSYPPTCRCVDQVEQCAATCKSCEPTTSDSSRHVCNDWYHGFPGPKCTEDGDLNDDVPNAKGASHDHQVSVAAAEKNGEEEERPWKCCDLALCIRSYPPTCRCVDQVEQCAATCKSCESTTSDSSRHVCNDWYHGFPGPKCTEDGDLNDDVPKAEGASHDHQVSVAGEKNEEEEERPWKCCDLALCTMSYPPTCRCVDQVEQCAATCKSCEPTTSDSSRHVCNDWYHGFPGPKCTEDGDLNDDVPKAKGASHDHQVSVAAAEKNGEEEERPWKCCDLALCTRSYPPTCRCVDQVEQCAATCKSCEPSTSDSSLHVCNDLYHGFPGPKCTEAVAAGGN